MRLALKSLVGILLKFNELWRAREWVQVTCRPPLKKEINYFLVRQFVTFFNIFVFLKWNYFFTDIFQKKRNNLIFKIQRCFALLHFSRFLGLPNEYLSFKKIFFYYWYNHFLASNCLIFHLFRIFITMIGFFEMIFIYLFLPL